MQLSKEVLFLAKQISDVIWSVYDDTYGYRSEKMDRNNQVSLEDSDNIWFFWNQFDCRNQTIFEMILNCLPNCIHKTELKEFIRKYYDELLKENGL